MAWKKSLTYLGLFRAIKSYLEPFKPFKAISSNVKQFGSIWSHLESSGFIWIHFELFRAIESFLEPFGAIIIQLGQFGAFWSNLEQFGEICIYLEPFRSIWNFLEPFGAISRHLEPFGSFQSYLRGVVKQYSLTVIATGLYTSSSLSSVNKPISQYYKASNNIHTIRPHPRIHHHCNLRPPRPEARDSQSPQLSGTLVKLEGQK